MLRKFPASNVLAAIFKNAEFFLFEFLFIFIINGITILFSKHGKIERWKRLLLVLNLTKLMKIIKSN